MDRKKAKLGKKGGARRITEKLTKIRRAPLAKEIFRIVDEAEKQENIEPQKKIAVRKIDLEG